MVDKHTKKLRNNLAAVAILTLVIMMILGSTAMVNAAATTVTLKVGAAEKYGHYSTHIRWVTHINGVAVDLDDEPGVTRSYAYCVQPALATPDSGVYNVTVIDDDNTGRTEKMRKMIYYLPGAYGYKKVTKSRWFNKMPSNTSAYTLGHVALSYLYDNCKSDTDAFMETNGDIKDKVKSMVSDMKNLADPPEDFEVFWIKVSGYQDTFGAFYKTEYGKASVSKTSALPAISDGNDCYSLEGAKYTLYEDSKCKTVAKTKSGSNAVIATGPDGSANPITVETGEYYIRETAAPPGYALNLEVAKIEIKKDKTTTYEDVDVPKSNPVEVLVQKVDKETGLAKAQGAASLEDAEFEVRYYDAEAVEGEPLRTWVFKTDADGRINMQEPDKYLIADRSSELYRNSEGMVTIPIGTVAVRETKAPKGYCLNEEIFTGRIMDVGTIETLDNLETLTGANSVKEQVHRGDLSFTKSIEGGRRLGNVPFRLTSLTTGESHIVVTDMNGYVNTENSWNPHETMDDKHNTYNNGVWFNGYNDVETGAPVVPDLGALPYDRYQIDELPCDANKDCELVSDIVTITRHQTVVKLGTYDDKLKPLVPNEEEVDEPEEIDDPKDEDEKPEDKEEVRPKTGDDAQLLLFGTAFILACFEGVLLTLLKKNDRLCNEGKERR